MDESPYLTLGLKKVINASGKMTALGGTAQSAEVAEAQRLAARHHVDLRALRLAAGAAIAERTGAEAASVTTGAAAGIAIGVAAMITGTDERAVRALPEVEGRPREIVLQAGHDVDFGARVVQMVRLGGGRPVVVGDRDQVGIKDIEGACSELTAGLLFVQSHHTRQAHGVSLVELLEIGRRRQLPVLVDAAAEEDLTAYVAAGADLVTYSGGKAIGGPTVGFVAGRGDLIDACELQNVGIGRAMKVGKEQIGGLLAALDQYPSDNVWPARLEALRSGLESVSGVPVSVEPDPAGRVIERVGLRLSSAAAARKLVDALRGGDPAVHTRNHQIEEGLIQFDVREVTDQDVPVIIERVRVLMFEFNKGANNADDGTAG